MSSRSQSRYKKLKEKLRLTSRQEIISKGFSALGILACYLAPFVLLVSCILSFFIEELANVGYVCVVHLYLFSVVFLWIGLSTVNYLQTPSEGGEQSKR